MVFSVVTTVPRHWLVATQRFATDLKVQQLMALPSIDAVHCRRSVKGSHSHSSTASTILSFYRSVMC